MTAELAAEAVVLVQRMLVCRIGTVFPKISKGFVGIECLCAGWHWTLESSIFIVVGGELCSSFRYRGLDGAAVGFSLLLGFESNRCSGLEVAICRSVCLSVKSTSSARVVM